MILHVNTLADNLSDVREKDRFIHAEKSDLFDILAYIGFASTPTSKKERVSTHRHLIFDRYM